MKLTDPAVKYDQAHASENKRILEKEDARNYKRGSDVEIAGGDATRKPRLILIGTAKMLRWSVTVDDTLTTSPQLVLTQVL